ncbi:MAG TPA: efflux RND transporter periplasmic adaptor subunit [Terriglobales bacterium]|nr:efflux RND transporter periplasmic adaptor subunit [Terriglobales bacterium]
MDWIQKNKVVVGIVAIVVIFLLIVTFMSRGEIPVRAQAASRESIQNSISTNGKIEPVDNFEAHAIGPAPVRKILVKEGDTVKAGQLLLQLDDADARAQAAGALAKLRGAEAALSAIRKGGTQEEVFTTGASLAKARTERDSARRGLDAMRKLQQRGAASAAEVEAADNRLKQAEADVAVLEQKTSKRYSNPEIEKVQAEAAEATAAYEAAQNVLRNTNITSPRAGTVYSLPVREGAFVAAGDLLVQVADLRKMQVRAFIDEPEIGKLAKAQHVGLTWDAVPGRIWEGVVTRVPATVITKGTRTVGEVVCEVDNKDLKLLPNVNVSVMIASSREENALTVPREAIMEDNGARFVYQIVENKLRRKEVKTGISSLTKIEIKQGLDEKSLVALGSVNGQALSEGSVVKVVER